MVGGGLARARWRFRGAWLWPMFVVLALVDGLIGHALPAQGMSQGVATGIVVGLVLNLLVVVLLSGPAGALLRRLRGDLPVGVARNYAGTVGVALVTAGFLAVGLAHQESIHNDQSALRDAVVRAQAFIGDRAPAEFRRNMAHPNTFTIQPGKVYRTCVPNDRHTRTYCVIVQRSLPLAQSVRFDGYTPNSVFAEGVN